MEKLATKRETAMSCREKRKAYSTVERYQRSEQDSDSDVVALVVHEMALSSANKKNVGWIIDSGATCHMCNDINAFTEYVTLRQPQEISLGDGHIVKGTGKVHVFFYKNIEF